jgi:Lrp/AsnC family transcriptional regulator, leucine-responsive regulatory protein
MGNTPVSPTICLKLSEHGMDDKDQLLLQLLQKDGRAPILDLARKLNLSRSATQARLAKLVKSGRIKNFTITLDAASPAAVSAHMLIRFDSGENCSSLVPKIKRLSGIVEIHSVAGSYDLVVRLSVASVRELENTREKIDALQGATVVETLITLESHAV